MIRDTLFIGHANPEDNDFTLWLRAKLLNEGFKAECDLSYLIGGEEDYWKKIQQLLEVNTAKYILVLSKNTFQKQGVIDEWEQVKIIAKKNNLQDFIYILKIDDVPFDVRIGVPTRNHFRFDNSWASGLQRLFIKLALDVVPKSSSSPLSIESWSRNRYANNQGVIEKKEIYYSNWLPIQSLPEKIYFFRYYNDAQSKAVEERIKEFPIIRHDNYIISFSDELPTQFEDYDFEIEPLERIGVPTKNAFEYYEGKNFPTYGDLRRFLVRILKQAWNNMILERGLQFHEMSRKTKCYFYQKDQLPKDKVFFNYEGKSTYKQLIGEFGEAFWHYGISNSVILDPVLTFSLNSHLLFSDNGTEIWKGKKQLHKARRSKGKSFFNKEWRSLQLAFLASLSEDKNTILIPLSEKESISLSITPMQFYSDYGYEEPKSDARLVPVDYYEESEDEFSEFEETEIESSDDKIV